MLSNSRPKRSESARRMPWICSSFGPASSSPQPQNLRRDPIPAVYRESRAGIDLTLVSLLIRHTLKGRMALTLGVYGDAGALLVRKRQAIGQMTRWIAEQRKPVTQTR